MATAKGLHLQVLTPTQMLVSADGVSIVHAQLADGGGIGILPGHAPLIAETVTAALRYRDDAGEHEIPLAAGILQVEQDSVTVLTRGQADPTEAAHTKAKAHYGRLAQALLASQRQASSDGDREANPGEDNV